VDISIENEWSSCAPRTQIVAIGAPGAIDGDKLREQFERCLAAAQELDFTPAKRASEIPIQAALKNKR
jgi:hypothetical protein